MQDTLTTREQDLLAALKTMCNDVATMYEHVKEGTMPALSLGQWARIKTAYALIAMIEGPTP